MKLIENILLVGLLTAFWSYMIVVFLMLLVNAGIAACDVFSRWNKDK